MNLRDFLAHWFTRLYLTVGLAIRSERDHPPLGVHGSRYRPGRMTTLARYSVVRYVEDLDRDEPVNVGVLLESEHGDLVYDFVDRSAIGDPAVIGRFAETIGVLVNRDGASLQELAARRFGHFRIDQPLSISLDTEPRVGLSQLVERLASEPRVAAHSRQAMRTRVFTIVCKARDGEHLSSHELLVWQWVASGGGCHACPPRRSTP